MYAIVRTGGKQYRVEEGRTVTVERLPSEEGATVELGDVLLIASDGEVTIGTPLIEGARVLAQVEAHGRAKKIIVFKYKAKVRTRKKTGHRQHFTRLAVREILRPGQQPKEAEKPKRRRRRKKAEATEEAPAAETAAAEPVEAVPAAEAPAAEAEAPAPKRRARRTKPAAAEAPATGEVEKKPVRRRRKTAEPGTAEAPAGSEAEKKPPTRRRSTRRKTSEETE